MSSLPYVEFADCVLNTCGGQELFGALSDGFPNISRADIYFGIGLAWVIRDADLIHADREIRMLRQLLAQQEKREAT